METQSWAVLAGGPQPGLPQARLKAGVSVPGPLLFPSHVSDPFQKLHLWSLCSGSTNPGGGRGGTLGGRCHDLQVCCSQRSYPGTLALGAPGPVPRARADGCLSSCSCDHSCLLRPSPVPCRPAPSSCVTPGPSPL